MKRLIAVAVVTITCFVLASLWLDNSSPAPANAPTPPQFADEQACQSCHQAQFQAWTGSHHQRAMLPPSEASVRGDFSGQSLTEAGEATTLLRHGDQFRVRISGTGEAREYPVAWTFGWEPLQQYLLALDDGRLQALGWAWDTEQQRWFHLYADAGVNHRHPLHWQQPAQSANSQCIECHSTGFHLGFDATTQRFNSQWHSPGVGCQSCHGPAADHLRWAQAPDVTPAKGFTRPLSQTAQQLDTCGTCHSRRTPLGTPGGSALLQDDYLLSQLTAELYEVDGKIQGEVFEYASFLQSRMHQAGVVCSDCHNPHSGQLRAPGNAVCTQCHNPDATPLRSGIHPTRPAAGHYDSPSHHHHRPGSAGAECRACHMPGKLYMGNDLRHDHSFSSPNPAQAIALGHSDACLGCHGEHDSNTLISAFRQRYPNHQPRDGGYAQALFKARHGQPSAAAALHRQLARDDLPALRRAALVAELPSYPSPASQQHLLQALQHHAPAVRRAALESGLVDARQLQSLMQDPVRAVRVTAAEQWLTLADQQGQLLSPEAFDEYRQIQQQLSANAEAHFNLANLYRITGQHSQVLPALQAALQRNPNFSPAIVLLAQWQESAGDSPRLLEQQLQRQPHDAMLHHALGLARIRAGQLAEGVLALEQAHTLAPNNDHHAYVLAIAWHDSGQPEKALQLLRDGLQQQPASRLLRQTLLGYLPAGAERNALLHELRQQNPQDPLLHLYPAEDTTP